ncbi:MAG TPA: glycosyltransferase [Tepidisphaeraceae bacterium]|nr:glycosyltransferase [Tepidisphaeraceae bacterium]
MKAHVLYVLPVLQPAGAERIVAELARRIPAHGFETSVVCLEDERAPVGAELVAAGVPVRGLRLSRRKSMACSKALGRILPEARPLIIHSHLFHANLAARMAVGRMSFARRQGIRTLSTVHVVERRFRPWQFLADRLTARWAVGEVCVSQAVAKFQQAKTGLRPGFFAVIENGIDTTRFEPRSVTNASRGQHVVSVGRLDPQKDFPTLLRAWQGVCKLLPDASLTIAGEGPSRGEFESLVRSLGLRNVQLPGFVNDVAALLRSADLYVQTSAWEGFGLAVVEAMCCGLPVIVTDVDSLPEIVQDGKTGVVVPKGASDILAAKMTMLLKDPDQARALGVAAREEAVRRFSVERMVADYASLYETLLYGRTRGLSLRQ